MSRKIGKLTLFNNANRLLHSPTLTQLEKGNKQSYSWGNEDYRQAAVNANKDLAISKPEDYIAFPFRHLSSTIVGGYSWKAAEFSDAVLKDAAKLLTHMPACVNHSMETSNVIGLNGDITFVGKSKAKDGTIIPGGLEGPIWIDSVLHSDLTRKLTGYPVPHIQSVSVTVLYEWKPSHEFTDRSGNVDDWEFEMKIGTIVDGTMVRRVVTKIIQFYETSLVFIGADPFAKILDEAGKPMNIEKSAIVGAAQFDKDPLQRWYKETGHMYLSDDVSFSSEDKHIDLRERIITNYSKTGNFKRKYMEKSILKLAGNRNKFQKKFLDELEENYILEFVEAAEPTAEVATYKKQVDDLTKERDTAKTSLTAAEQRATTAEGKVTEFEKIMPFAELETFGKEVSLGNIKAMASMGAKVISVKREECTRLYKLAVGEGKTNEAMLKNIETCTPEVLEGLLSQYGKSTTDRFTGTCNKCKSTDVSFRSSANEEESRVDTGADNAGEYNMAEEMMH